jgi:hypothetical protein
MNRFLMRIATSLLGLAIMGTSVFGQSGRSGGNGNHSSHGSRGRSNVGAVQHAQGNGYRPQAHAISSAPASRPQAPMAQLHSSQPQPRVAHQPPMAQPHSSQPQPPMAQPHSSQPQPELPKAATPVAGGVMVHPPQPGGELRRPAGPATQPGSAEAVKVGAGRTTTIIDTWYPRDPNGGPGRQGGTTLQPKQPGGVIPGSRGPNTNTTTIINTNTNTNTNSNTVTVIDRTRPPAPSNQSSRRGINRRPWDIYPPFVGLGGIGIGNPEPSAINVVATPISGEEVPAPVFTPNPITEVVSPATTPATAREAAPAAGGYTTRYLQIQNKTREEWTVCYKFDSLNWLIRTVAAGEKIYLDDDNNQLIDGNQVQICLKPASEVKWNNKNLLLVPEGSYSNPDLNTHTVTIQ